MKRREALEWVASFALAIALLMVYDAPWWAFAFVGIVGVLFTVVQTRPPGRVRSSREQVIRVTFEGQLASVVRLAVLLGYLAFAAIQGDGMVVVFGVLIAASLVLVLLVVQVLGIDRFDGS